MTCRSRRERSSVGDVLAMRSVDQLLKGLPCADFSTVLKIQQWRSEVKWQFFASVGVRVQQNRSIAAEKGSGSPNLCAKVGTLGRQIDAVGL